MTEHNKTLIPLNGEEVEIDTSIVHLIEALNDYGIKTKHSCEGDKRGYIAIAQENVEVYIGQVNGEPQVSFNLRFDTPQVPTEERGSE